MPVLILQFDPGVPPGYFASSLTRRGLPWRILRLDAGETPPETLNGISGIGLMGGRMSANDALPWIDPVLALIRAAVGAGMPVIGHCLGGQLMSRALGGSVGASPTREIGWGTLDVADPATARPWLGGLSAPLDTFQWHAEAFSVPAGAVRILSSPHCPNQAFVYEDRHLAMQCHVEMTPEIIADWCARGADEIGGGDGRAIQPVAHILAKTPTRIVRLHRLADALYSRWTQGLTTRPATPVSASAL